MNPGNETPTIRLLSGRDGRARHGHPWIYSNEIAMDAAAKVLAPGGLVSLVTANGKHLGVASFNPHTLIAARLLHREASLAITPHPPIASQWGQPGRALCDRPLRVRSQSDRTGCPSPRHARRGTLLFVVQVP